MGEYNSVVIDFAEPGCFANVRLKCSEVELSGRTSDLSDFVSDSLTTWQVIKMSVSNQTASFYLNDHFIRKVAYQEPIGALKGINYSFVKEGTVDYLRMYDHRHRLVYAEEFDGPQ